jgi:hypothetical protein
VTRIAFRFVTEFSTAFLRVLKHGGSLVVHTAFLQLLHEAPFHFYNATEHGVRSWFKDFGVEKCHVSTNFTVPFMLAFLLSQVLESVGASSALIYGSAELLSIIQVAIADLRLLISPVLSRERKLDAPFRSAILSTVGTAHVAWCS